MFNVIYLLLIDSLYSLYHSNAYIIDSLYHSNACLMEFGRAFFALI